jgi:lipid A 3-O-deacylase
MQKYLFTLILVALIPTFANAKKLDSLDYTSYKELFLKWDNDLFIYKDYYYTQGAHIFYVDRALRKNPVNNILLRLKNADNYFGLGLIHEIYTPKNINDSLLNVADRPYAGTFFIRTFISSSVPHKRVRITTQFDLGMLGPFAGARQMQKYVHSWFDFDFPKGWDFQVDNRPYINYNILADKGFISNPKAFDLIGTTRLRIGSIYDDLNLGITFRTGRFNDYFKGLSLSNKKYKENKKFQLYALGGFNATIAVYNATIMGEIVPPESDIGFKFNHIKNLIGEAYIGAQMSYRYIGIKAQITWQTPDFDGGEPHNWGTLSMYFRF